MRLMLSFNRNMLALFLAANLLTGAVNLSINTLAVGRWGARSIVGEWQRQLGCVLLHLDAPLVISSWGCSVPACCAVVHTNHHVSKLKHWLMLSSQQQLAPLWTFGNFCSRLAAWYGRRRLALQQTVCTVTQLLRANLLHQLTLLPPAVLSLLQACTCSCSVGLRCAWTMQASRSSSGDARSNQHAQGRPCEPANERSKHSGRN
jgi:hypothetical protein